MIRVIDFETTGMPPEADVVEAAFVDVEPYASPGPAPVRGNKILLCWSSLVIPTRPVGPEARAAHHLTDAEIAAGITWQQATAQLTSPYEAGVYCAHNADFEKAFFNPAGSRWVDTYKCALRLWPDAPKHSNQVLRYYLPDCDPGTLGMPPHRALPDCHVTAWLLLACLIKLNGQIERLIEWSDEPPLLPRVTFGLHRTKRWDEVPTDYLRWVLRSDFDQGVLHTARVELKRRLPS